MSRRPRRSRRPRAPPTRPQRRWSMPAPGWPTACSTCEPPPPAACPRPLPVAGPRGVRAGGRAVVRRPGTARRRAGRPACGRLLPGRGRVVRQRQVVGRARRPACRPGRRPAARQLRLGPPDAAAGPAPGAPSSPGSCSAPADPTSATILERLVRDGAGDGAAGPGRTVLVVDQFEEVWTACDDEGERAAFLDALAGLVADGAISRGAGAGASAPTTSTGWPTSPHSRRPPATTPCWSAPRPPTTCVAPSSPRHPGRAQPR